MNVHRGTFFIKGEPMKIFLTAKDVFSLDWQKNPAPLRDRGGVYMIREKGTDALLYIGQSGNLGNRLAPSVHPVYKREKHDVYVLFEGNRNERRYMECRFIELLHPLINIRRGLHTTAPEALTRQYYDAIFEK